MSRRILFLLGSLLLTGATVSRAQIDGGSQANRNSEFAGQDGEPLYYSLPRPWSADMRPNPKYPITVRLSIDDGHYTGISFIGRGQGHIFNPAGENLEFKYRCGTIFAEDHPVEFYARWVTPRRKLEILLREPGTNRTRTCRINTTFAWSDPIASSSHTVP